MIFSIVVGLVFYYTRTQQTDNLSRFGDSINSPRMFEEMVLKTEAGRPTFDQLAVHSQLVPDGKGAMKPATIVTGMAFNGHYEKEGSKFVARWRPTFFVGPIPYKPRTNLAQLRKPGGPDFAAEFRAIKDPTVVDFLNILGKAKGITYKHAWWREPKQWQCVAASFAVVGIIWPIFLNLIYFGRPWCPKTAKATSLINVAGQSPEAPIPMGLAGGPSDIELPVPSEAASPAAVEAPAVAAISTAPLDAAKTDEQAQSEFGAAKDDFYPTEVHVPHKND
jgi:hypothetical protein